MGVDLVMTQDTENVRCEFLECLECLAAQDADPRMGTEKGNRDPRTLVIFPMVSTFPEGVFAFLG